LAPLVANAFKFLDPITAASPDRAAAHP